MVRLANATPSSSEKIGTPYSLQRLLMQCNSFMQCDPERTLARGGLGTRYLACKRSPISQLRPSKTVFLLGILQIEAAVADIDQLYCYSSNNK